ncbi:MAG: hypothetical protein U1F27_00785 [Turneriella sp.]
MKKNKLTPIILSLILAPGLTGLIHAAEAASSAPAATAPVATETKTKTGKYLFEDINGYGGSLLFLYGNGSSMNDTISFGVRGFVHFGNTFRLGAIATMTGRTNFSSSTRETSGSVGLFGEYLLRFDPFIIGLGVKAAGAGYGTHDTTTRTSGTKYAYFNAMPFAELEFRLLEHVSLSVYGGYDYFVGNSGSPNISQGVGGVAITLARY